MAKKINDAEKNAVRSTLKAFGVKPGARVYTIISHVSSSGMTRHVKVFVVGREGGTPKIFSISGLIAKLVGYSRDNRSGALIVQGCGFDAGHDAVYNLGRAMFPEGGPVNKSVRVFQEERAGKTREVDGGYLLKHHTLA